MSKTSQTNKGSRRSFAITSLGRDHWYWVVWPSLNELQDSLRPLLHIAEGQTPTKEEAVEKALDAAGMYATWIAAKYARAYYQNTKSGKRSMGGHQAHLPTLHEFLYRDIYDPAIRQWVSKPHRILQRTGKYIYVEQRPFSPEDRTGGRLEGEPPAYRLDREALEQQGYAFIPASASLPEQEEPVFFISERNAWDESQVPQCLKILHLSWPCTITEVQETYKKMVRSAHPDGGGSHEQFIELQAAYEQALKLCR
jgi:hypothetical protein